MFIVGVFFFLNPICRLYWFNDIICYILRIIMISTIRWNFTFLFNIILNRIRLLGFRLLLSLLLCLRLNWLLKRLRFLRLWYSWFIFRYRRVIWVIFINIITGYLCWWYLWVNIIFFLLNLVFLILYLLFFYSLLFLY